MPRTGTIDGEIAADGRKFPRADVRRTALRPLSLPLSASFPSFAVYGELGETCQCATERGCCSRSMKRPTSSSHEAFALCLMLF